jgi:hypothetical protein
MKSAKHCVYLQAVLPIDQASDSDVNNVSSSHSDASLPIGLPDLATSSEIAEAQPSQSNEGCDSDGCVIVGYVKPRHERTPEVITLLSSDPEVEEGEVTVSRSVTTVNSTLHDCSSMIFAYCVLPNIHAQKQTALLNHVIYSFLLP